MKQKLVILACLAFLFSCAKEVQYNFDDEEQLMVLESKVLVGQPITARCNRTRFFLEDSQTQSELEAFLKDVSIRLIDNKTGTVYLPDSLANLTFYFSAIMTDDRTFTFVANHPEFDEVRVTSEVPTDDIDVQLFAQSYVSNNDPSYPDSSLIQRIEINDPIGLNGFGIYILSDEIQEEYDENGGLISSSTLYDQHKYVFLNQYLAPVAALQKNGESVGIFSEQEEDGRTLIQVHSFQFYNEVIGFSGYKASSVRRTNNRLHMLYTSPKALKYFASVAESQGNNNTLFSEPSVLQNAAEGGIGVFAVFKEKVYPF